MKKIYILAITFAFFNSTHGQTINESFNPKPGNKYTSYVYNNKTHSVGSAGADQTYDFSDLGTHDMLNELIYENAQGNPNNFDFPNSDVLSKDKSGNYIFFETSVSSNNILGKTIKFEGSSRDIIFSNPQTIMLPLALNTLKTDEFKGETSFLSSGLPVKLFRFGKDSIKVDGYGTLKLNGITKKVNRLSIISNYTDSVKYISDIKRKNVVRLESYYFIGENEDYPTVVVSKERLNSVLDQNSTITQTNTITVNKPGILGNYDKSIENSISVWAGSKNEINIKGLSGLNNSIAVTIYGISGNAILSEQISNEDLQVITLPASYNGSNNLLIVSIYDGKSVIRKKLIH